MDISNKNILGYGIWISATLMMTSPYILISLGAIGLLFLAFVLFCEEAYKKQSVLLLLFDTTIMTLSSLLLLILPDNLGIYLNFIGVILLLIAYLAKKWVIKNFLKNNNF
ncbi:hypothetical protein APT62_01600 [Aerococcus urinaeequi]|nr:hypothetical protein APT62_01600 [Aerococcus urinaeequi]